MSIRCSRCNSENEDGMEFCSECEFPLTNTEAHNLVNGRYRMTKPYVFSSFRAVYEAEDIQDSNRIYSVREFLPQTVNPSESMLVRSQFESTMMKFMELNHKNLAGIVNFFIEGAYYYVVYDYINGMDMTKYLDSHKIVTGEGYPERLVSHWTLQMCDLVEYLHHGHDEPFYAVDLKPAGIVFRQEDEQLVFIDMGLFKLLQILGPHYLITEDFQAYRRAHGKFETTGWDIFCIGNFMYYLLSGIDLVRAPETVFRPIKVVRPDISVEMAEIVTKAVGELGQSHYKDVRDLKMDLREKIPPRPLRAFDFYGDFVTDIKKTRMEWRMLLANEARTNCMGLAPRAPLRMKWKTKLRPSTKYYLTASENFIYATCKEGFVTGAHCETGDIDWKFYLCRDISTQGISSGNMLYYVTPLQSIVAIEHGKNDFFWKLELDVPAMGTPTLYDEIIFLSLYNGRILAINALEGNILTEYKIDGNIISSPIVHNSRLYVTSLNKIICALDIDTEEEIWSYEAETGFSASPTLINDKLFVGSHDGTLCAVNIETGTPVWTRNFIGSITQSVRATPDMIYFTTRAGKLVALDPDRGNTRWERDLGAPREEYPFCLGSNMIYLVDAGKSLRCLDSFTGEDRSVMGMSHNTVSQLMIAHNQLYLVSRTGHLAAFG